MSDIAIGIDLGTSNSCVAIRQGSDTRVLANAYGERTTASVVFFQAGGSISVGNAARAGLIHDPARTICSAKRLIGRYFGSDEVKKAQAICSYRIVESENHGVEIAVADERFTLPEISAMVLREMKTIAEAQLGETVTKAVITVPAYFNDNQRQATKDAGRIAGLEVLRILNEPTAAALAYGFGKGLRQRVAVWDLGGGTFDISVLEIGDDVFEVLATCGDTFLGGDDFDDRVIDLLADEFVAKHGINPRNDPFALEKLKIAAEGAKKALSVDDEVQIRIPDVIDGPDGQPLSIERNLTSAEYAKLVYDLIQRTFGVCDTALGQAGVVARDLDGVILVGGPTRLPLIRNAVREYFQKEPKTDVDPDEVVAMGAAIHAASLVNPTREEAFLLDVTPLSLRIGVAGGLAEAIIERNTPVPIEQTRRFTTFQDFQESVDIRVYQGESRSAHENELLGQFTFSGFEKARRGEVSIDITFEINADGIVNVRAKDLSTGKQASTRITLSAGLSEGEIETIIQTGRTERVSTASPDEMARIGAEAARGRDLALDEGTMDAPTRIAAAPSAKPSAQPIREAPPRAKPAAKPVAAPASAPKPAPAKPVAAKPAAAEPIAPRPAAAKPAATAPAAPKPATSPAASTAAARAAAPEAELRPIEIGDLIGNEIEIPAGLIGDDSLTESDDLLELEGLDEVTLAPAADEPPPEGKITAIDEDLTTTAPTFDDSPEALDLEDDLFEKPGTDLSNAGEDDGKR
ncbi:MAG TPA: Hsp70 family protein [Myxococcota bacterium]|nr:Hsp70 family protein [Myxococcota bacterium]